MPPKYCCYMKTGEHISSGNHLVVLENRRYKNEYNNLDRKDKLHHLH